MGMNFFFKKNKNPSSCGYFYDLNVKKIEEEKITKFKSYKMCHKYINKIVFYILDFYFE